MRNPGRERYTAARAMAGSAAAVVGSRSGLSRRSIFYPFSDLAWLHDAGVALG